MLQVFHFMQSARRTFADRIIQNMSQMVFEGPQPPSGFVFSFLATWNKVFPTVPSSHLCGIDDLFLAVHGLQETLA